MATIDIKLKSYDELIFEITTLNTYKYLLQQENKQLKEEIEEYKRIEQKDLEAFNNYDSILTELEEWLNKIIEITANLDEKGTCKNVLDKIQELKEKYK